MTTETAKPAESVAKEAIAQQATEGLKPGEVVPEVLVNATPAPNAFASEDAALEAMLTEQKKLDDAKAKQDATAGTAPAAAPDAGQPATGAPAAAPAKSGQEQAAEASKHTVESAVIALRKKSSQLALENAALKGENSVLKGLVKPGGEGAAPAGEPAPAAEQTFEEAFAEVDAKYASIAEQIDDGKLSMKEAEEQRKAIRERERQLNDERAQAVAAEATARIQAPANDLGLQEHVTQLVEDFPVLKKLSKEQLLPFEQLAYEKAVIAGNPIPDGPLGTKRLREEMAVLAESFYDPTASAARVAAQKTGAAPGNGGQPAKQGGAQPAPASGAPTAQQREEKLRQAGNMPPDIGNMGTAATGGEITQAQGEAILASLKNEDEVIRWLDQHPQFVQKTMGGSMRLPTR